VSAAQLISAFHSVAFHATTTELNGVIQKFGNGRVVRWLDLIEMVEPKPLDRSPVKMDRSPVKMDRSPVKIDRSPVKMDRSPVKMDRSPVKIDRSPVKIDNSPITNHPHKTSEVLRRISRAVVQYGVNLREEFAKIDGRRTGLVSARSLKDILDSVPVRLSMNEIFITLGGYFTADNEMLNYQELCDDLAAFDAVPPSPIRPAHADQSLRQLKAALIYRRIGVDELFVTHDSGRTGMVANEVVGPCCRPIAALVSVETIQQITTDFRDSPRSSITEGSRRCCPTLCRHRKR
jgi:hypothetical protein